MYLAPSVPKSSSPSGNNMPERDRGQVGEKRKIRKEQNMVDKQLENVRS